MHLPLSVTIGERALVFLRGLVALYMLVGLVLIIDYEIVRNKHGWLTAFEFSNVAYFPQLLYQWVAFVSRLALRRTADHSDYFCRFGPSCTFNALTERSRNVQHSRSYFRHLARRPARTTAHCSASSILRLSHSQMLQL